MSKFLFLRQPIRGIQCACASQNSICVKSVSSAKSAVQKSLRQSAESAGEKNSVNQLRLRIKNSICVKSVSSAKSVALKITIPLIRSYLKISEICEICGFKISPPSKKSAKFLSILKSILIFAAKYSNQTNLLIN